MSRLLKQLLYGAFYLALFGLSATLIYFRFVRPEASCVNNLRDSNEEGVDCGGVCESPCLPQGLKPLVSVGEPALFYPRADTLTVLTKVQNPNFNFAAKKFRYRLEFYGDEEKLINTVSGESFLYAGEIRYMSHVIPVIPTGFDLVRGARLVLEEPVWAKADDFKRPLLVLQDIQVMREGDLMRVDGRLTNRDAARLPRVHLLAVFYGSLGQPVGVSLTELESVAAGDVRAFSILHPALSTLIPSKTEVVAFAPRP